MASFAKRTKRAVRSVTMAWRHGLIDHSPGWARTYFGPGASYLDMLLVDHGIFRLAYLNKHRLSHKAWRSGVKTIVNLRGERVCGSYWWEQRACERAGVKLVNYQVRSRAAPEVEEILGAKRLFETIEYPILMHCKSGADRAGLMSVLYRHFVDGWPIEEAKKELSLKYGHIRQADTGVLDYFFERYLQANAEKPVAFLDWLQTDYDPVEVKATFRANGMANRLVNGLLRRE